jgi:putative serine protease PepD
MTTSSKPSRFRPVGFTLLVLLGLLLLAIVLPHARGGGTSIASSGAPAPASDGFAQVVSRAVPSVVQIRSARGLGSGVVLDGAGHVVTNAHVVAGSQRFNVTLADGSQHSATLRGTYPAGDLAVVQLRGARPRPATFADSSRVSVGAYALAIGNPLGLRSSVTQGIVSSTSRTVSEGTGATLPSVIQTSAPINPGNSGGALVDATGAVIGIPTLAATDPQLGGGAADGIGFAISSNTARSIAAQLVANGEVLPSARTSLGAELRTMPGKGAVLASVRAAGPAAKAGARAGDVIVRVAGRPTASVDHVAAALAAQRPGRKIAVDLDGPRGPRRVHVTPVELKGT